MLDRGDIAYGNRRHFKKDKKAENEIRTRDPRITNALLYQLSYFGVKGYGVVFKVYLF